MRLNALNELNCAQLLSTALNDTQPQDSILVYFTALNGTHLRSIVLTCTHLRSYTLKCAQMHSPKLNFAQLLLTALLALNGTFIQLNLSALKCTPMHSTTFIDKNVEIELFNPKNHFG